MMAGRNAERQGRQTNDSTFETRHSGARGWLRQLLFPRAFKIVPPRWPQALFDSLGQAQVAEGVRNTATVAPSDNRPTVRDTGEIYKLIADLATGIWRIRRRVEQVSNEYGSDGLRGICRHVENSWDLLQQHRIEVKDDVGQKYVAGMALQVLAFQPSDGVERDTISETIRPSIFFNDTLIQRGEVIVATPNTGETDAPAAIQAGQHESLDTAEQTRLTVDNTSTSEAD